MKEIRLLLLLLLIAQFALSQHTCGFDERQHLIETKHPEMRQARLDFEARLNAVDVNKTLKRYGALTRNALYSGQIFEIPVVVHVIEPSATSPFAAPAYQVSDAQIETWIDSTNKMYATTHHNFFPEGTGNFDGAVIPFRLALAKRTPDCQPTNGILRVSAASLSAYNQYGVYSSSNGATEDAIKALSPHWDESTYFNIYIITTFDGNTTTYGLMGWCGYPTNSDYYYESFMKVASVTNPGSDVLAHEFGHGMGLMHTFGSANSYGGDCPSNNNCATDNDRVCDTEPGESLLQTYVYPLAQRAGQGNNPCTGAPYQGVQYNVMNYTSRSQKFTPGQRERALLVFMETRGSLTTSLGATPISSSTPSVAAAVCSPASIAHPGNYYEGPTQVQFGSINNISEGYSNSHPEFYIDYTSLMCQNTNVFTDVNAGESYTVSVNFMTYPQWIKVWIDYNNDGQFDASELVANSQETVPLQFAPYTATIEIPTSAVTNTYLRMRVYADDFNYGPCDNLAYGQIEDYAVRIIPQAPVATEQTTQADIAVIYDKASDKVTITDIASIGKYTIYNTSGAIVLSGIASTNEIALNSRLTPGFYILKCSIDGRNVSQKIVVN